MDACCSSEANNPGETVDQKLSAAGQAALLCPGCSQKGKHVEGRTVKSMIAVSLRLVGETPYYFCRSATCPVVYFSADGKSVFTTDQLRERVYQKETGNSGTKVCYCFDHRVGDIQHASPDERNLIVEDINAGISANQCACDLRNPQGSCCLGNVLKLMHLSEV